MANNDKPTEEDYKNAAEDMINRVEKHGYAASTMQNGHMIMLKREMLEKLLRDNPRAPILTLFLETKKTN